MPWNGSGQFNRDTGVFQGATVWDDSRLAARTVRSDDHDTHDEDIATGLENTVTRDGQNSASANLPMATFRHTGVGNAAARTDYAAAGQIQDQGLTHIAPASVGGTGDAITLSPTPGITAYAAGQRWSFLAEATNTVAVTVNVSALGTKAIQKLGAALVAGDITTADLVEIEYDGTQFQMLTPARTAELKGAVDSNGNEVVTFGETASAVNEITVTNAAAGGEPSIAATGDDTDIDIELTPKGAGALNLTLGPLNENKGADIASATTTDIGAATGNQTDITGTITIIGLGTVKAGAQREVEFDGILTLTHNATSLILPGGANITTAAGDTGTFISLGAGNWRCHSYNPASGLPVLVRGLIQRVTATDATFTSHTTTIAVDDTIPQQTEGDEILTAAITPKSASNILRVTARVPFSNSTGGGEAIMAIFRDSTADAVSGTISTPSLLNDPKILIDIHEESAGSTSATTFKLRIGPSGAFTMRVNGTTARLLGGVSKAILIVEEIAA